MESIKELRRMLQEEKVHPKGWSRPFGYKTLQRGPSIYITRFLLLFPITPNQITITALLMGIVGCVFVFQDSWELKITGIAALYVHTLLDRVDGEVARYKKRASLKGIYLDEINHLIIPPVFFLSFTFGMPPFTVVPDLFLYIGGVTAALSFIVIRITNSLSQLIFIKKYIKSPELFFLPNTTHGNGDIDGNLEKPELFDIPARLFHLTQEFFIILLVLGAVMMFERLTLLDYMFYPLTSWLTLVFGVLLFLIAVENVIKGWFIVEFNIARISRGFKKFQNNV
ncbi:MAG: hypothetical protein A3C80_00380 [Candidatus Ryanbacteria bacterium RIFCSPHIGHO2_02_FULL_45_43]|uniref:CDP-alcohol phosphatidyltransferase n=1 Tax=Candidatus Ryanbacteria bacterium RIFCSPHIGHO2_01_45_13 TaxID=1802112 RepID=A0A1G2FXE3_9BACT|nr:MAG: hypothetical protein A2718_01770 [Candidatus Ryanbacteria bacterium RIFCSPHIGHO2_01_FULL_44_130]OGZ42739.1 MAG: hypothetical protein A2W41_03295 [Candidatus Ryanbacteria bacterium RIFCSPHIGHO2_01_45_13]OGZ48773.1 MAG: hypothetical protein A3C80_00380 [Candidatus Ryanbacteria bacterium RIFCSPHIGHO2_02_FULL_45_43]OGZ50805.1 MAG: hypothetical protein A3E55_02400 [Candidatus Ryanbacteria bacterium RIFCSPHIGHO2_12_FULL_44_20]OGZ52016.1 MAG: hypothetical protein A3A17_00985 [Candidatus Ryanba